MPHEFLRARPLWADVDLDAISHNIALVREKAGRPVKLIVPIKANAYGHGVVPIARHLEQIGVDGLATANVADALAVRAEDVRLPILIYGAQLPEGIEYLVRHDLTPTIYSSEGIEAAAAGARQRGVRQCVHVKVDAGLGRLGVRLDDTPAFVRDVLVRPELELEGIYTHIPFSSPSAKDWSSRRLVAFARLVRDIELEQGIHIRYAQAAASSILSAALPDALNTISPGHLVYGLAPIDGMRASDMGFRKALGAVRAQLIHTSWRRSGDDLAGVGGAGATHDQRTGVILFGMDNGYRPAASGRVATMLCRGTRCPVLAVSAEYCVIDLSPVPDAVVGDVVTIIGPDGNDQIDAEDVAADLGAPSAAYWMVGLKSVPMHYQSKLGAIAAV